MGIPFYLRPKNILFFFQTTEKQVLPSADDVKAEKTHQGLLQGVEGFTPDKLKPTKTREPESGADCKILISQNY